MSIRLVGPAPSSPPDPVCVLLDAGHELADAVIDAERDMPEVERFALRCGVALLHAWLRPASCPAPS